MPTAASDRRRTHRRHGRLHVAGTGGRQAVDQRSDVFSLGIILYEMATGQRPFKGDTHMSTLSAIIKDTPKPIAEVRPRPAARAGQDHRSLPGQGRRGPLPVGQGSAQRSARAQERADVRRDRADHRFGRDRQAPATVARHGRSRRRSSSRLRVVLAVLSWRRGGCAGPVAPAVPATRPFDSINLTRLTTTGTRAWPPCPTTAATSRTCSKGGKLSLWLRQVATTSNVEIVPPAEVRYIGVTFSPDGNHIYYATYGGEEHRPPLSGPVLGGGSRLSSKMSIRWSASRPTAKSSPSSGGIRTKERPQ